MKVDEITKEMYVEWKANPVTKAFLRAVESEREKAKELWANGNFEEKVWQQILGFCIAMREVLNVEFADEETQNDNSSDSVSVGN